MTRREFVRLCAALVAAQIGGALVGSALAETESTEQDGEEPP